MLAKPAAWSEFNLAAVWPKIYWDAAVPNKGCESIVGMTSLTTAPQPGLTAELA